MVPEDELDACPWACGLDVGGGHVLMAIRPEMSEKVVPLVRVLAAQYELICFDPQAGKVHLPPRLSAQQEAAVSAHLTLCRTRERAAESLYSPPLAAAFSWNIDPLLVRRRTISALLWPVWLITRSLASIIAAVARPTRRMPGIAAWRRSVTLPPSLPTPAWLRSAAVRSNGGRWPNL
jgi:hypothetical protein